MSITAYFIFTISIYHISDDFSKPVIAAMIFAPVMLHNIGHTMTVPLILRYALEDYSKVTGTAGSIFGFLYYTWVAFITYNISYLHGESIMPFAIFCLCLTTCCFVAFRILERTNVVVNNKFGGEA